jgi:hypothetical protein
MPIIMCWQQQCWTASACLAQADGAVPIVSWSHAVQVPDAKDDVLAAAVLDQAGPASLPPGTEQLLAALPKHFPITVSTFN